ncbi:MAG TPA: hypothetical protein VL527_10715 [Dongiaceae bacterium]|jgi:hypothetical protein|nr:hypothetical protein [Dongiaceae bacterium]
MVLPEDISTKVRQDFAPADRRQVLQLLTQLLRDDAELFNERILRAIVVWGNGSVSKLVQGIAFARDDWRDLITAAESRQGNRVQLLALPFGTHPDLEQITDWLDGYEITVPWAVGADAGWTIRPAELRGLSLEQVHQLQTINRKVTDPNQYLARLHFLCIHGGKEISATKAIEGKILLYYRRHPDTGRFSFERFICRPQDLEKRGKW